MKNNLGLDRFVNFEDGVNLSAEPALAANEMAEPGAGLSTAPTHSFLHPTHYAARYPPRRPGRNPSPVLSVQVGVRVTPAAAAFPPAVRPGTPPQRVQVTITCDVCESALRQLNKRFKAV